MESGVFCEMCQVKLSVKWSVLRFNLESIHADICVSFVCSSISSTCQLWVFWMFWFLSMYSISILYKWITVGNLSQSFQLTTCLQLQKINWTSFNLDCTVSIPLHDPFLIAFVTFVVFVGNKNVILCKKKKKKSCYFVLQECSLHYTGCQLGVISSWYIFSILFAKNLLVSALPTHCCAL